VAVSERRFGRWWWLEARLAAAVLVLVGGLGAVPGDVGGCGAGDEELDPPRFYAQVRAAECQQCQRCAIESSTCLEACAASEPVPEEFPEGCVPLVHDGWVCLRALQSASCRAFAEYVDERDARMPTECDFCPEEARP
jgi:hypothetical protein